MATTETPGAAGTPAVRPGLLIALAVVAGAALLVWTWPTNPAVPAVPPSNAARPADGVSADGVVDPAALDVRLEALEARGTIEREGARNPFRFQPREVAAPPPSPVDTRPVPERPFNDGPPPPPAVPPITVKFIGTVEPKAGDRVAVFSDCRAAPTYAREGGVVLGQYRLVRIGIESVVMEHVDGRGRTTIRLQGQECVGK